MGFDVGLVLLYGLVLFFALIPILFFAFLSYSVSILFFKKKSWRIIFTFLCVFIIFFITSNSKGIECIFRGGKDYHCSYGCTTIYCGCYSVNGTYLYGNSQGISSNSISDVSISPFFEWFDEKILGGAE